MKYLTLVFLFSSISLYAKSELKLQISDSRIKPWLNFNDGYARSTFNTAVHGQALYFDTSLHIRPGYIKSWEWDYEKKKYTFEIDTSRKYSNGESISAYDFEYVLVKPFISTADTALDRVPLGFIKGVSKLKPGMSFKTGMVDGIRVTNNKSLEVYLASGHSRFLYSLGSRLPALGPISEFKSDHYTFKSIPIGSGPYRVSWSDPNSSTVHLKKVYGDGPSKVILFSEKYGFENDVDVAFGGGISKMYDFLTKNPGKYRRIQSKLPFAIQFLEFNHRAGVAADINFRKAVTYAIDKYSTLTASGSRTPIDQVIPNFSYGYKEKSNQYNLNRAKEIVANLPKAVREREHILLCHGAPGSDPGKYYRFIRDSLVEAGLKVKIELTEDMNTNNLSEKYPLVLYGKYVESYPLTTFAHYLPGNSHVTMPTNEQYEKVFAEAEAVEDLEKKVQLIHRLSEILRENYVVLPLYQRKFIYYKKNHIEAIGSKNEPAWNFNISEVKIHESKRKI
ncbi:ABC transporter substrate-binding protein [Pseudobacteriovorax antillogorgiicola]|uniref:ABC-type transport system, substrate-binding protein n=1 Tax=Pseudobacteriovorax antillogorgiicola TaxID=1513793 RepID=A0A1Y6BC84_9BACT|nr:ABC transporter substrate-binding protein [Pseudobacteriovorax antillogorgiicola]TCS58661.1 ABC-type transport system substrate-binding protein [Pseudobacteriovorax antillogorgiicola]SME96205.1 ABC-type transport system, substrate-binding protein [Pseudobacteriovorax antillogorgiicola]